MKGNIYQGLQKFSNDKVKYKLKTADLIKTYKDKFRQAARNGNITVNEATLSSTQELTYSVEQVEQLLGNLKLSGSKSY